MPTARRGWLDRQDLDRRATGGDGNDCPAARCRRESRDRRVLRVLDSKSLDRASPALIVSSGAQLNGGIRRALQAQFECPVTDVYATSKFGVVGCECVAGQGLHVDATHISPEQHVVDGISQVVLSSVRNTAMLMLRFVTGDAGTLTFDLARVGPPRRGSSACKERPCRVFSSAPPRSTRGGSRR